MLREKYGFGLVRLVCFLGKEGRMAEDGTPWNAIPWGRRGDGGGGPPDSLPIYLYIFPQHLVEGLLNFRRRVCRSFWLDLAFQDPPRENGPMFAVYNFFIPPTKLSTRVLKPQCTFFSCPKPIFTTQIFFYSSVQYCTVPGSWTLLWYASSS